MLIQRKYIRSLPTYFGGLIPHTDFRLVADLAHVPAARRTRAGFDGLADGDTLLPSIIGKTTRFNAEGRFQVHRDQPKESRLIGSREWTREEWAGPGQRRTVTEVVDIYRDCYPRSLIAPPGVELTRVDRAGAELVIGPTMTWTVTPDEQILHTVNLMLELFGEVEVRHEDLTSFLPPHTQRVNWTLLPPGNTAAGVSAHVSGLVSRAPTTFRAPIMSRLTFLAGRNPTEVYLGHGGFHAYVAYVFPNSGKTVLESVMPANATYVFDGNWHVVAHLTKTQILAGSLHHDRIVHDRSWTTRLAQYAR